MVGVCRWLFKVRISLLYHLDVQQNADNIRNNKLKNEAEGLWQPEFSLQQQMEWEKKAGVASTSTSVIWMSRLMTFCA